MSLKLFQKIKELITPDFTSLKLRLFLSLLTMAIIILPTIAIIIMNSYEKHMMQGIKNELSAYSYSILAVAEVDNGKLIMPLALADNQFNVMESGLYAFITNEDNHLWRSQSLLPVNLPPKLPVQLSNLESGEQVFSSVELDKIQGFIFSYAVSFYDGINDVPLLVHIVKDKKALLTLIEEFNHQLWIGLGGLMSIILLMQIVWLIWTLKPLSRLQKDIHAIEQGKTDQLTSAYPTELTQLTRQLNQLLLTEKKQRQRYRNALSDLAHSLKTPLAVLQAQDNKSFVETEQLARINAIINHQLTRAQSAGHSAWHLGILISPQVKKLLNALNKIYQTKAINTQVNIADNISFKGDEADFIELLGNLLDNAFKAAKSHILLNINILNNSLVICIEDDGEGFKQAQIKQVLERGIRGDTYQDGHGVGLAIVRDLVESYQGTFDISYSQKLAGAKCSLHFSGY